MTGAATREQLSEYAARGCFRIKEFAAPAVGWAMAERVTELARAAERGTDISPAFVMLEQQADYADGREPEERLSKIFRLHRDPIFSEFVMSPAVCDLVRSVLDTPDIACFLSQFIFKNPGAWGQPWHQDSFYFPFEPARPVVEIIDHDMTAAEPVCMEPGELLVFDSHLMHRSMDNTSDGMRAAMVFHFASVPTVDRTEEIRGYTVNDWMPMEDPRGRAVGSSGETNPRHGPDQHLR